MGNSSSKGKLAKRIVAIIAVIVVACIAAFAWYVNDYAHADATALAVMADEDGSADGIVVQELSSKAVAIAPQHATGGIVFYPGAKVQPESYAPLFKLCAEQGLVSVIVRPQFNLALFDEGAADGIVEKFPNIDSWIIAGHSMGGVAASDYLSQHPDDFHGIAFLASYPNANLADYGGSAVSLTGSNDGVLNRSSFDAAASKLPATSTELVIEGGNHAYFGNYGEQANDGQASITREEQQRQTAQAIVSLAQSG